MIKRKILINMMRRKKKVIVRISHIKDRVQRETYKNHLLKLIILTLSINRKTISNMKMTKVIEYT